MSPEWTMLSRWRVSYAALLLSVVACGNKPTAERIAEHDRVRVSWEQTARLLSAEWIDRAIPDAYATRTLARAGEELRHESDALAKDSMPEADRVRLRDSLRIARARADTLARAIRSGDRGAVARLYESSPRARADSLLRAAELR
jgi:hypothetical protein